MHYSKFAFTLDLSSIIDTRTGLIAAILPYQPVPYLSPITDPCIVFHDLEQREKQCQSKPPSGIITCSMRERYFAVMEIAGGKSIAFRDGVTLNNPDSSRVEFCKPYQAQYSAIDHAHIQTFLTWSDPVNPKPKPYSWGLLTPPASLSPATPMKSILVETNGEGGVLGYWTNFEATVVEHGIAGDLAGRVVSFFTKANRLARSKLRTYVKTGMKPKLGTKIHSSKSYHPDDDLVHRLRDQMLRARTKIKLSSFSRL